MTVQELIDQLNRLVTQDPAAAQAEVVFGPEEGDDVVLNGGIYGSSRTGGQGRLLLAPIKLDGIGGF